MTARYTITVTTPMISLRTVRLWGLWKTFRSWLLARKKRAVDKVRRISSNVCGGELTMSKNNIHDAHTLRANLLHCSNVRRKSDHEPPECKAPERYAESDTGIIQHMSSRNMRSDRRNRRSRRDGGRGRRRDNWF